MHFPCPPPRPTVPPGIDILQSPRLFDRVIAGVWADVGMYGCVEWAGGGLVVHASRACCVCLLKNTHIARIYVDTAITYCRYCAITAVAGRRRPRPSSNGADGPAGHHLPMPHPAHEVAAGGPDVWVLLTPTVLAQPTKAESNANDLDRNEDENDEKHPATSAQIIHCQRRNPKSQNTRCDAELAVRTFPWIWLSPR